MDVTNPPSRPHQSQTPPRTASLTKKLGKDVTVDEKYPIEDMTLSAMCAGWKAISWVRGYDGERGVLPWRGNMIPDVFCSNGATKVAANAGRNATDLFSELSDQTDLVHSVATAGSGNCKEHATATTVHVGAHFEQLPIFTVGAKGSDHSFTVIGDWRVSNEAVVVDSWVNQPFPHLLSLGDFAVGSIVAQYPTGPRPELKKLYEQLSSIKPKYDLTDPGSVTKLFEDCGKQQQNYLHETASLNKKTNFLWDHDLSCDHPYVVYESRSHARACFDIVPEDRLEKIAEQSAAAENAGFPANFPEPPACTARRYELNFESTSTGKKVQQAVRETITTNNADKLRKLVQQHRLNLDSDLGWSMAELAAANGSVDVIADLLLAVKEDSDYLPKTLMDIAIRHGHLNVISLIVQKGLRKLEGFSGLETMAACACEGRPEMLESLIRMGLDPMSADEEGNTIFHLAAMKDIACAGIVKVLVPQHCNVNAKNKDGDTPLHMAAACGAIGPLKCLLAAGGDPALENHAGWSVVHVAANEQEAGVLRYLAGQGYDINPVSKGNGMTPWEMLDGIRHDATECLREFLQGAFPKRTAEGSSPGRSDGEGRADQRDAETGSHSGNPVAQIDVDDGCPGGSRELDGGEAMDNDASRTTTTQVLSQPASGSTYQISIGTTRIDPSVWTIIHDATIKGDIAGLQRVVQEHGFDLTGSIGETLARLACANDRADVLNFLVGQGANLDWVKGESHYLFTRATENRHFDVVKFFVQQAQCKLEGSLGNAALYACVASGRLDVFRELMSLGLQPTQRDEFGNTALLSIRVES